MGLHENMVKEPVRELPLREPVLCGPDASIREAIQQMRQKRLGCVIVIDDGSDPPAMPRTDERVRLVRQANAGPSAARNAGLDHVSKPIAVFLDADDVLLPAISRSIDV